MAKKANQNLCPCCSGKSLDLCCARFLTGKLWPETAEELMRSRYTAYVLGNDDWLRQTWATQTCPSGSLADADVKWLGLKIEDRQTVDETHATVTFVARGRYRNQGAFRMREKSSFEKRDGKWLYVDGVVDEEK
ncbi:MAG: YchJ family metal-binding protein [Sutterellaceae bacterium]|nr:YchJ family metal-binding protein [Sutterellaceae bacterium]